MDTEEYVKDSWDIHVHAAPSLFPRWGDAIDLVRECSQRSMAGIVLKYHHGSSVEAAYLANRDFKDIRVFGGVTLNYPVGGLNPHAVDTAITLGGRVVWLPTIHALNHEKTMGRLGGFHFQKSDLALDVDRGITITDEKGKITESVKTILDLLDKKTVVLATGHISPEEIYLLKEYVNSQKLDIRILINHALFRTTRLSESQIKELSDDKTWFETVYLTVSPVSDQVPVKKVAKIIGNTLNSHWIIATDSGQINNIRSPDALSSYAGMLVSEGIDRKRVTEMLKTEPKSLLDV